MTTGINNHTDFDTIVPVLLHNLGQVKLYTLFIEYSVIHSFGYYVYSVKKFYEKWITTQRFSGSNTIEHFVFYNIARILYTIFHRVPSEPAFGN